MTAPRNSVGCRPHFWPTSLRARSLTTRSNMESPRLRAHCPSFRVRTRWKFITGPARHHFLTVGQIEGDHVLERKDLRFPAGQRKHDDPERGLKIALLKHRWEHATQGVLWVKEADPADAQRVVAASREPLDDRRALQHAGAVTGRRCPGSDVGRGQCQRRGAPLPDTDNARRCDRASAPRWS